MFSRPAEPHEAIYPLVVSAALVALLLAADRRSQAAAVAPAVPVDTVVQRWTAASRADFDAAPRYDYRERIRTEDGSKTYDVTMLFGTPYQRLIAVNEHPLSESD